MANLNMFDLSGSVAIVTGGNGGIGRGIALGLADAGAKLAIAARNAEKNRAVLDELKARGADAVSLEVDLTRRAELRRVVEQVEQRLGPVSILVNNAGIAITGGVLTLEAEQWDRVLETNLNSYFLLTKHAARSMVERKSGGKIINIASEYSRFGSPAVPAYSATKGGVIQLTKSTAIELAPHNIQVNAIVPGWIETDMTAPVKSTPFYKEIILRTPAGRFGTPDECAGAAVFLASRASDFVTGSTVFVDGGYAIR